MSAVSYLCNLWVNDHVVLFVADNTPSVGVVAVTPITDDDVAFAPEACDDLPQLRRAEFAHRFPHGQRASSDEVGQDACLWLSQIFLLHSFEILKVVCALTPSKARLNG